MKKGRGLSTAFMAALVADSDLGVNRFLQAVKKDQTLCLEIRENYVNIYYRGGNLTRLEENNGKFSAFFDQRYILDQGHSRLAACGLKPALECDADVTAWIEAIPWIKQEMDWWFCQHPKVEREFQQLMVRENNFGGTAKGTDYFICDIEYANEDGRFDLVAAHWPSTGPHRKDNENVGLAFIEMKYMNKAMARTSGICDHVESMRSYFLKLKEGDNFAALKEEMRTVFNQKLALGLIDNQKEIKRFDDQDPLFILAFANHNPGSEILIRELRVLKECVDSLPFNLRFAASNFMGYGLYDQDLYDLDTFMDKFSRQIFCTD